jgi:hypothetical protein
VTASGANLGSSDCAGARRSARASLQTSAPWLQRPVARRLHCALVIDSNDRRATMRKKARHRDTEVADAATPITPVSRHAMFTRRFRQPMAAAMVAAIGGVLLLKTVAAHADNYITDTLLDLTPTEKDVLKDVGDVAGAISSVVGVVKVGVDILNFLNILPTADANAEVLQAIAKVQQELGDIKVAIYAEAHLASEYFTQNILADSQTGYEEVREAASASGALVPTSSPTWADGNGRTLNALNNLTPVSGDAASESNPYFQAVFAEESTDGPVTTTVDVKTTAEWKLVISDRTKPNNGLVFDWREGLPALLAGLQARLSLLALTASPSDPTTSLVTSDARNGGAYADEIMSYEQALSTRLSEIGAQIHCGEAIWAVGATPGDYLYKWYCTDTSTGITGKVEQRATVSFASDDPTWNCSPAVLDGRLGSQGLPDNQTCYNLHWQPGLYGHSNFGTTHLVNAVSARTPDVYDPDLIDAFKNLAPQTSAFTDILQNGRQAALNNLLAELGLFNAQRMVDALENIWQGESQPSVNNQIKNWGGNLCLDLDTTWVGAETLSSGQSQMIPGYPFILNDCSQPTDTWTATWAWDANTGEVVNIIYALYGNARWCLSASSTRRLTPLVTALCDGSPSQVWTWNAGTGLLRNEAAVTSPLTVNGSGSGASIVIGYQTLEQSSDASTMFGGI